MLIKMRAWCRQDVAQQIRPQHSLTSAAPARPGVPTWIASRIHVRWKVDANHQRQKRCRQGCVAPLAAAAAAGAAIASRRSFECTAAVCVPIALAAAPWR